MQIFRRTLVLLPVLAVACFPAAAQEAGAPASAVAVNAQTGAEANITASAAANAAGGAATGASAATVTSVARGAASDGFADALNRVSPSLLAELRGGTDTVNNDMRLNGAVTGNTAINIGTGANTISSGSFSNASGLPIAIQNSGANVLIQNATIINIQMQ